MMITASIVIIIIVIITVMLRQFIVNNLGGPLTRPWPVAECPAAQHRVLALIIL